MACWLYVFPLLLDLLPYLHATVGAAYKQRRILSTLSLLCTFFFLMCLQVRSEGGQAASCNGSTSLRRCVLFILKLYVLQEMQRCLSILYTAACSCSSSSCNHARVCDVREMTRSLPATPPAVAASAMQAQQAMLHHLAFTTTTRYNATPVPLLSPCALGVHSALCDALHSACLESCMGLG